MTEMIITIIDEAYYRIKNWIKYQTNKISPRFIENAKIQEFLLLSLIIKI